MGKRKQEKKLPQFPYSDLRLTPEQAHELADRIDKNRELLTDAIGLSGHLMMIDDASIANIAAHYALAGVGYLGEEQAYIWGRRIPDESGVWRAQVEWLVIKDHPVEEQPQPTAEQAAALREQLKATVPAGLLDALREQLVEEYENDQKAAQEAGQRLTTEGE